jgi:hypothetical protein
MHSFYKNNSVFFERKRMLKKEAAGWEGPAAEKFAMGLAHSYVLILPMGP